MRHLRFALALFLLACASGSVKEAAPGDTSETAGDISGDISGDSTGDTSADTSDTVDTSDTSEPWTLPSRADTEHPTATDSWRWGGGVGYPDLVDPTWPVVTSVTDLATLTGALASATAGTIVYVADDAEINLTGQSLCVPAGVWVASGRGVSGSAGGLIYATEGSANALLNACGDDVRITGLRFRGPDPETCPTEWPNSCPEDVSGDPNCAYCTTTAVAIRTDQYAGLEVDNNELSGWTYAAVAVKNAEGADVHHNHIHHGWREGLGYGVVLYGAEATSALIRGNRFDAMRHVVAGQGYPTEDYVARDNLVEGSAISHVFDMHGENEIAGDGSSAAGGDIRVYQNVVLVEDQYSFVVRGKPATGAWFYANCLAPSSGNAYDQRYYAGNFHADVDPTGAAAPNAYSQVPSDCGSAHWCLRDGGEGAQHYGSLSGTPVDDLLVGDLNGDGKDDVFTSTGAAWRYANPNGGSWTSLASSAVDLSALALVDLDGDGTDDVFYANGTSWQWSKGGTSSWATLKSSAFTRSQVGFGDFNGDGAMDVFTTDGARWSYHPNGSGAAVTLATSSAAMADLRFGDFDGDGTTDVFSADGANWRWSKSGSSTWANLASSSEGVSSLGFADLNGDGITDVLDVSHEALQVSISGRSSWSTLRHQRETLGELLLGDFDGDTRADVLVGGCL